MSSMRCWAVTFQPQWNFHGSSPFTVALSFQLPELCMYFGVSLTQLHSCDMSKLHASLQYFCGDSSYSKYDLSKGGKLSWATRWNRGSLTFKWIRWSLMDFLQIFASFEILFNFRARNILSIFTFVLWKYIDKSKPTTIFRMCKTLIRGKLNKK